MHFRHGLKQNDGEIGRKMHYWVDYFFLEEKSLESEDKYLYT